jgi:hypothetical protein
MGDSKRKARGVGILVMAFGFGILGGAIAKLFDGKTTQAALLAAVGMGFLLFYVLWFARKGR